MPASPKNVFICNSCGYESLKWRGQCPNCHEWNTFEETIKTQQSKKSVAADISRADAVALDDIAQTYEHRYKTGSAEFDRVLGGGLVKGSVVLLSGDPGIGKSTILLQICEALGQNLRVLYISGEESSHQLKLRADRLGVKTPNLSILCDNDTQYLCEYIRSHEPDAVIVDSIQTMNISDLSSSSGSITQVRESANLFARTAKTLNIPVIIVGHVNKDGNIAGPKVLEHIVDTVLYFEGERNLTYRILRTTKNRFGSTNEIGVFEMCDSGLKEIENPSLMLIQGRPTGVSGTCIACVMEGSRPILAEVQGLVTPTGFGTPRRMANGFDYNRMSMLLAVLEKRAGYFLGNMDCYVNIVGGLRIDEPASDLSVALAIISSFKDSAVKEDVLAFGEVGLAGELRAVSSCEQRIYEAARLGFKRCIIPYHNYTTISSSLKKSIEIVGAKYIRSAFEAII